MSDRGKDPYVFNIEDLTKDNDNFRTAEWTGQFMQLTTMSIPVEGEVGLEVHEDTDQFLRIEAGTARVVMGPSKDTQDQEWEAGEDFAILVPAGTWHNIVNIGEEPLKLYSLYAPSHHPFGTVHETYEEAMEAEKAEENKE